MTGLAATEHIMAHSPDADPGRVGVDQSRRAVPDLRGAGGRRGRRAGKADRVGAARPMGGPVSGDREAGLQDPRDHPPAGRGWGWRRRRRPRCRPSRRARHRARDTRSRLSAHPPADPPRSLRYWRRCPPRSGCRCCSCSTSRAVRHRLCRVARRQDRPAGGVSARGRSGGVRRGQGRHGAERPSPGRAQRPDASDPGSRTALVPSIGRYAVRIRRACNTVPPLLPAC